MKVRTLLSILILIVVLLIASDGFARRKKVVPIEEAIIQLEGVYTNTEYSGYDLYHMQKCVIRADGIFEKHSKANIDSFSMKAEYEIVESWYDSRGHLCCTANAKWLDLTTLELWKLNIEQKVFESTYKIFFLGEKSDDEYPKKMIPNPDSDSNPKLYYVKYYRQD
jgi:hypothetical protein